MRVSRPVLVNGGLALVIAAAAVGAVLVLVHPFSSSAASGATQLTSTVRQGTVSSTISASGTVAAVREVSPSFAVSGTIATVDVALGQTVTAGQQLGTLETADLKTAVSEAYSSYVHAKENTDAAKSATPYQVSQVNQAKDAQTKAWDQYESAKADLASATLTAPIAGLVVAVTGTVGGSSGGSASGGTGGTGDTSTGFVTIADTTSYVVTANIAEADIADVTVGQDATVTFPAKDDATATAKVTAIAPTATTSNSVVTYATTITLTSVPDGLRLGQTADVAITIEASAADSLYVPTAAVTTQQGTSTVKVVDAKTGKMSTVTVTTGIVGDEGTEIKSGLKAGQTIVIGTVSANTNSTSATGNQQGGFSGGGGFPGGGFPSGGGGFPSGGGSVPSGGQGNR